MSIYKFGTVYDNGEVKHNTHTKKNPCLTSYEWECLLAGEQIPKEFDFEGNVTEWEFLEECKTVSK